MYIGSHFSWQVLIDLKLGIYIEHGEDNYFMMKVRDSYVDNICGLCGDYNGNPDDDWTTGPYCHNEVKTGSVVSYVTCN